jgi:hypothetical protein
MNSHGSVAEMTAELSHVGRPARRRIAYRLKCSVTLKTLTPTLHVYSHQPSWGGHNEASDEAS